ncbi:MAG TPA: S-methyl-5'-thioadenosine phosphorylase [Firmicutes bacterium]|nr:S-methyl-5'-thioadenosine phosphorylase [Bacillota bacterium]
MARQAEIGIFGGSGFYSLLEEKEEVWVETPYGAPSERIALGEMGGKRVAFLPRHGKDHRFPPHMIPYRANLWAMKQLGVTRIIAPCAAGSLQPHVQPGDFVIADQLVDRTSGRRDTFLDGPNTTHITFADPYCAEMRQVIIKAAQDLQLVTHKTGTVVVIQGPRFSTRAESRWFHNMGWEVINMTQYPECVLARELNMCYANISLITDYDAGLEGRADIAPVSHEAVLEVFSSNIERLRDLLAAVVQAMPVDRHCDCGQAVPEF